MPKMLFLLITLALMSFNASAQSVLSKDRIETLVLKMHQAIIQEDTKKFRTFLNKHSDDKLILSIENRRSRANLSVKSTKELEFAASLMSGTPRLGEIHIARDSKSAGGRLEIASCHKNISSNIYEALITVCKYQIILDSKKVARFVKFECKPDQ